MLQHFRPHKLHQCNELFIFYEKFPKSHELYKTTLIQTFVLVKN